MLDSEKMKNNQKCMLHTRLYQQTGHAIISTNDPITVIRYAQAASENPNEAKCLSAVFTFPDSWVNFEDGIDNEVVHIYEGGNK